MDFFSASGGCFPWLISAIVPPARVERHNFCRRRYSVGQIHVVRTKEFHA